MILRSVLLMSVFSLLLFGCHSQQNSLTIFYAPCFSPVVLEVKDALASTLNVALKMEVNGSQMVCRKVTELQRECDVALLADARLFKTLMPEDTSWRIEFAHDEIVLGIGIRAPYVDKAETDWIAVLRDDTIVLGRVNENLGPIGFRTLLVWKYLENSGHPGLSETLIEKTTKVLDHVDHLSAMLKNGDVDYGFLYKTTCRQNDIRYISLPSEINQGSPDLDYTRVAVQYQKITHGKRETVSVPGSRITYGVSIPRTAPNKAAAIKFIRFLLRDKKAVFEEKGYRIFQPQFYGSQTEYHPFSEIAVYQGEF
jgi:molybdate/tungstate transport system substrate-binding protein